MVLAELNHLFVIFGFLKEVICVLVGSVVAVFIMFKGQGVMEFHSQFVDCLQYISPDLAMLV